MDFEQTLKDEDKAIFDIIRKELKRQQEQVELIASENIVSRAVMEAQGSVLTNKYAEGYPAHRYYCGCEYIDEIETLAQQRAQKLFNAQYVNVQPHSGSQANTAVYVALLNVGDTIMGMSLDAGGHLTHGSKVSISGKFFNAVQYGVRADTGMIDYDEVETLALDTKPKLIIAGGSAYPRQINFARFRQIADRIGAYLMVDMAHFAGLVAGGQHPNPLDFADVVTTTTHKTLRGPRGGMILTNNPDIYKKVNSAVFPGTQGGPLEHVIAAKAVCFGEDLTPQFRDYAKQVIVNAKVLGKTLVERGVNLVSGGTDTHLVLVDLRPKGLTGDVVTTALERAHITCNKNAIPFDPQPPKITSGVRLGTPAGTTRGFKEKEFAFIGNCIGDVIDALSTGNAEKTIADTAEKIVALCHDFPIYE
ncbi:MAG: serine hydroxymethyltransferase [Alphaproteobacteria bacterium]|nr:serine hydroxymethyltransferase [Alphaproteobacteria bacterium]MBR3661877.1 serine hydroxymethyltransferase [Alphaproteobacteria bacterium]